ncbi:MAG TPA: phosphotransferase [Halothiobacillus sp.]|nr:phosphotransferase [Halothiobacillus sp.]
MSIIKFAECCTRRKIGFLGTVPTGADDIFRARGYECVSLDKAPSPGDNVLWELDCLILIQNADEPKRISEELQTYAPLLLPRDGRIYILPASQEGSIGLQFRQHIIAAIDEHRIPNSGLSSSNRKRFEEWDDGPNFEPFGPFAHVFNLPPPFDWDQIANVIRSNSASAAPPLPAPSISATKSNEEKIVLYDEATCLLQRAFDNCLEVDLVAVSNGLSGIGTFKTYVKPRIDRLGQNWPYVYFVKLGERRTIATEYRKYKENAMDHVPYHLGPRLRQDRCALGHKLGVIVTDYVHTAESLRDCARDGRAGAAIGNLFSHTLRNWRGSAKKEEIDIREHLKEVVEITVPPHRIHLIKNFGANKSHLELRELLLRIESKPTLMGVIHNDLHATNVLVRANDAIIIDFEKLKDSGPLLLDVASLEAGLFVDGFIGDNRDPLKLLASIDSMYTLKALDWKFPKFNVSDKSAWFFESTRLIRMHAREMERANRQYALVLAAVLLKKSCNKEDFDELDKVSKSAKVITREQARALAYVLAEKIILSLTESAVSKEVK